MMKYTIFILIAVLITSCYYDNKEELYPAYLTDVNACDTVNVSYANNVEVIMLSSCSTVGCHVGSLPSAGILLDNYTSVKTYVNNGQLMATIKHQSGFSQMPKGAQKLTDCQISQLDAWINAGGLNN